jgi:hypothetical protein
MNPRTELVHLRAAEVEVVYEECAKEFIGVELDDCCGKNLYYACIEHKVGLASLRWSKKYWKWRYERRGKSLR